MHLGPVGLKRFKNGMASEDNNLSRPSAGISVAHELSIGDPSYDFIPIGKSSIDKAFIHMALANRDPPRQAILVVEVELRRWTGERAFRTTHLAILHRSISLVRSKVPNRLPQIFRVEDRQCRCRDSCLAVALNMLATLFG